MFLCLKKRMRKITPFMNSIGIRKQQMTPPSNLRRHPASSILSRKSAPTAQIQRRRIKHRNPGVTRRNPSSDLTRSISRIVIDDDDLPLFPKRKSHFGLRNKRGKTSRYGRFFIPCRHNNGKLKLGDLFNVLVRIVHDFVL